MAETKKTGTGLEPNVAALLAYLFGWVGGLIFVLIEKDNKFVRFHAIQSIILNIAIAAIWIGLMILIPIFAVITGGIGAIIGLLTPVVWIGFLIVWIMAMVKAYQNEEWEIPVIGKMARKYV